MPTPGPNANPDLLRLAERLMDSVVAGTPELAGDATTLSITHYCASERLERERATLFRRYPVAIGAASELATPGTCLRRDVLDLPLVLIADGEGRPHAELARLGARGR